jgi:low temperature requirement protein LtrA
MPEGPRTAPLDEQEREQQQLLRPPDLNQDSNRSATRLELFFDLVFVLFIAGCADVLAADETWRGGLRFAALLAVGWWAWASTALYANRFDTDDVVFRLLTLTGMGGVVVMAATVGEVGAPTGRWFALGYALLRLVLVAGYLRAWRHVPRARPSITPYLVGHALGAAVWLASVALPPPARFVAWGVGIGVDLVGPAVAARREGGVPLHAEHLPDRFALLVILVLGESVAAVVTGVSGSGWTLQAVLAAALAFVVAVSLWWSYFDFAGGIAKRRLVEEAGEDTRYGVHDVYVYAHLPIALGLAAVAVGLEHAVLHGGEDHVAAATRVVLGGGLALYLASAGALEALMSRRVRPTLLWPGAGVPLVLVVTAVDLRPPLLLALVGAILLAGLGTGVLEHRAGLVRTSRV